MKTLLVDLIYYACAKDIIGDKMSISGREYHKKIRRSLEEKFLEALRNEIESNVLRLRENRVLIKDECRMRIGTIYSPRCDVAVGPFSYRDNNYNSTYLRLVTLPQIASFISDLRTRSLAFPHQDFLNYNNNPRCFISIEVEDRIAKDVKHLLGSMINSSLMGKLGIVVVADRNLQYATRLLQYLNFVERVGKIQAELVRNAFVVPKTTFNDMLQFSE